jgi:hypothetical protein
LDETSARAKFQKRPRVYVKEAKFSSSSHRPKCRICRELIPKETLRISVKCFLEKHYHVDCYLAAPNVTESEKQKLLESKLDAENLLEHKKTEKQARQDRAIAEAEKKAAAILKKRKLGIPGFDSADEFTDSENICPHERTDSESMCPH